MSAAAVIARAEPAVDTSKPADAPLTAAEAARMRAHFRFLKEHRKLLALKVNATEDLLLNGVREPTHRGICQHLLAKVERSRVELAVPRLDPAQRTRFLEGIIALSPDVPYLLLYLEGLRDAARADAAPALSEALERIDWSSVSAAQMRRLLDLIVELYSEHERPPLLFSLLQNSTFQKAFDESKERFPPALAEIVVPLSAAHAVIVRGRDAEFDPATLGRGAAMLLRSREKVLLAQARPVQIRLFDLGIDLCRGFAKDCVAGLFSLLEALPKPAGEALGPEHPALRLAGFCMATGLEERARTLLSSLEKEHSDATWPRRWREALDGPRLGDIGLTERGGRGDPERWQSGVYLPRQLSVWVKQGAVDQVDRYRQAVDLARELAVPAVCEVVAAGTRDDGSPYFAVARRGKGANEVLLQKRGVTADVALGVAREGVCILSALALSGVQLTDIRFRRFAVDDGGRLWLRDLLDANRTTTEAAQTAHLGFARELALDVVQRAPRLDVSRARAAMERAASFSELLRALGELG
ncbi:MAG: hypothetical protein U0263_16525 [Polyangiaceae bacterium]